MKYFPFWLLNFMSCLEIRPLPLLDYTNKTFSDKFISVLMLLIPRFGHMV